MNITYNTEIFEAAKMRVVVESNVLTIFLRKRAKPYAEWTCRTEEEMQGWVNYYENDARRIAEYEKPHAFVVGDILVESWGCEQTNIDFYQVVGVSKTRVKVRHIEESQVEYSGETMTGKVLPLKDQFNESEMKNLGAKSDFVNGGRSYRTFMKKWNGFPVNFSAYA